MKTLLRRVLKIEQQAGDLGNFIADQIRQLAGVAPKWHWRRVPRVTPEIQAVIDQMAQRLDEDARQENQSDRG